MAHPTERRLIVGAHRYGPGRTHRLLWDSINKRWYRPCAQDDEVRGEIVKGKDLPAVTCRVCDRSLRKTS